jgi:hypothetical protein
MNKAKEENKIIHYLDAPSLAMVLFKLHYKKILMGFFLRSLSDIFNFFAPLLVRLTIFYKLSVV